MKTKKQQMLEQSRRREMMDAAKKLFYLHGFNGTTMEEIAAAAGVSKGLIYHYFRSKEELLRSFWEDVDVYLLQLAQMEDAKEALVRFGCDFLVNDAAAYDTAPPVQILLTTFGNRSVEMARDDVHNPILKDFGREYFGKLFQKGMDQGVFRRGNARDFGDIYWSFLMGKLLPVKKGNENQPPEVYVAEILAVFQ